MILTQTSICFQYRTEEDAILQDASQKSELPERVVSPNSAGSCENSNIIDWILNNKTSDFSALGNFSESYEPSLEATYYALSILNFTSRQSSINQTKTYNFIMSHYDNATGLFSDRYSQRFRGMRVPSIYYPYSSPLEVNCFAVLSLKMLNQFNAILGKKTELIDFIWSCYDSATGGFIGLPYSAELPREFKEPTADNTYYAVITLDLLINWDNENTKKDKITEFVSTLQSSDTPSEYYGGFLNDNNETINTLGPGIFEPNLFSAYYCFKTLEKFNRINAPNIPAFNTYLGVLYQFAKKYFKITGITLAAINLTNLPATAIGLELGGLTSFSGMDRTGVINFILNHRNSWGSWDQSTTQKYRELIDTFEVLRSLKNTGEMGRLLTPDRDKILNAVLKYCSYNGGFSPLPKTCQDLESVNAIVSALDLYDRTFDINVQKLYDFVSLQYDYFSYLNSYSFRAFSPADANYVSIRSCPLEFYSDVNQNYFPDIAFFRSHKATFEALHALKLAFKLDDFAWSHNLTLLLNSIIGSQFLTEDYNNRGGFLSSKIHTLYPAASVQNKLIFVQYSYYAIRSMELIAEELGLGSITNLNFDKNWLQQYLFNNFKGPGDTLYFNPLTTTDVETLLEYTYYAIYTLKAINMFANIDVQKIMNYLEQHLNYANLKNVYYCFKINQILALNITFDFFATQQLIKKLYVSEINSFRTDLDSDFVDKESIFWVCDMARNDYVRINSTYSSSVKLRSSNKLSVSLCNMVLKDFGPYASVKFESSQIGTKTLTKTEYNFFTTDLFVNLVPTNYPIIHGFIRVYDSVVKISEKEISFSTSYELTVDTSKTKQEDGYLVKTEVYFKTGEGIEPLYSGKVFAEIFKDSAYIKTINLTSKNYAQYSEFSFLFSESESGEYSIVLYTTHDYQTTPSKIGELEITVEDQGGDKFSSEEAVELATDTVYQNGLPISLLLTFLGLFFSSAAYLCKQKRNKAFNREKRSKIS